MHNYRVIESIGSGTFGEVFLAEERATEQLVAIKVIKQSFGSLEDCLKLREVRALRQLKHPSLMSIKNLLFEDGQLLIVCEYSPSNLYDKYIASAGQLPSSETVRYRYLH